MDSSTAMNAELADDSKTPLLAQNRAYAAAKPARATELSLGMFLSVTGLVCVSIWAVVWVYISAFPMAYMDRNYPLLLAKNELAARCLPGDIAVFGDSRAVAGIMPGAMDIPVTNLAYPGGSPVENYFLVQRLLRCSTPPRLVVLAQSAGMYTGPHAFWDVFAHSGILSQAELSQVDSDAARLHDKVFFTMPHPSGVPFAILPALYGIHFPPLYFASLLDGYGFARERYNRMALQDIFASSGNVLFGDEPGSDDVADEARMTAWNVTPLTNQYLIQTLALLKSRHVPVAIITMPVNQATCAELPPVVQARLTRYLNGIQKTDSGLIMADSQITCWPDRYYTDDAHFNRAGAIAYSKVFAGMIKQAVNSPAMQEARQ